MSRGLRNRLKRIEEKQKMNIVYIPIFHPSLHAPETLRDVAQKILKLAEGHVGPDVLPFKYEDWNPWEIGIATRMVPLFPEAGTVGDLIRGFNETPFDNEVVHND